MHGVDLPAAIAMTDDGDRNLAIRGAGSYELATSFHVSKWWLT